MENKKHFFEGTEGEITWFVDYISSAKKWKITVMKSSTQLEDEIYGYEPKFGIDLQDSMQIEEILDKLIKQMK